MFPSVFSSDITNVRRKVQYTTLWESTLDKPWNVVFRVAHRLQATGYTKPVKETSNRLIQVGTNLGIRNAGDRRIGHCCVAEDRQCFSMAVGRRRRGKLED